MIGVLLSLVPLIGGEIQNLDLVKEAYELYNSTKTTLIWVRAHVGHDDNEAADEWANKARKGAKL
jgi:ribonuclease HI